MYHDEGGVKGNFRAEVPVGDAVQAVLADLGKAQQPSCDGPVQRIGGAGQGAAAQGHDVHAPQSVLQTGQVPEKHLGIGHQVVAKGDGLGPLHVGVARHHRGGVLLRFAAQHFHKVLQLGLNGGAVLPQSQAHIQGHLIVAAAGGVKALSRVADAGGKLPFHKGVDVLGVRVDHQRAAVQIRQNALQPLNDLLAFAFLNDAALSQHGGVGHAALNVLPVHPAVDGDAGVKVVCLGVGFLLEAAFPKLHSVPSHGVSQKGQGDFSLGKAPSSG